jgi:glycosyltransferase involved in cell wall biosynthesis
VLSVEVSVILPTYNRLSSLPAAVESVLSQSFRDLELIIVDDGSSEDVEGFAASIGDPRVRFIKRPVNGGAAAARNTGVAEAKGNYIAFQDSDDLWLPRKLERQIHFFDQLPADVGVVTGGKLLYGRDAAYNYGQGKVAYAPPPQSLLRLDEDQLAHLLLENRISLQNTLFRKSHIAGTAWFDSGARANEDWEFAIRTAQQTRIYEDIEPVVVGFVSADSISTSDRKQTLGTLRILRKNREILTRYARQHSLLLIEVGKALFRAGKYHSSYKFIYTGLRRYPPNIMPVVRTVARKIRSSIWPFPASKVCPDGRPTKP